MLRPAAVLILIAVIAALAPLAGCGDDDGREGLTFVDPKGSVDVERGMEFTLEFSVNAGVGYDWDEADRPGTIAIVRLVDTRVDYPDEERAGDSGVKRFVYEAREPGRQMLVFRKLFRGEPQERRTVTVNIRG